MSVMKGGDLMLFVTSGNTKKAIAYATSHTLTISGDTKETSSKDSGGKWQTSEVGVLHWTVTSENLCAAADDTNPGLGYDALFSLMIAREPIDAVFALKAEDADAVPSTAGWTPKNGDGYEGKVIITNLERNAPNGENVTLKVDFTGVGALTKVAGA